MRSDIHNERCFGLYGRRRNQSLWPKHKTCWFASGREALVALLKSHDFDKRVVILPAFLPEGIYAPFQRCEWEIHLYRLDKYLNPEWDRLESLIVHVKPRLAVFIDYFGLQKQVDRFCLICRQNGVIVIEDMAHLLPDPRQHQISPADFILLSLPKLFGVPDGASLIVNNDDLAMGNLKYHPGFLHFIYVMQQMAILSANTTSRLIPAPLVGRRLRHLVGRYCNSYPTLMKYFERPHRMSTLSRVLLSVTDIDQNFRKRCKYVRFYRENLNRNSFEFFPESDYSPAAMFGFPVLVDDRESLRLHLAKRSISGIYFSDRWDYIPTEERADHTNTISTMSRHFLFPTSPHLRYDDIKYVVDSANSWQPRTIPVPSRPEIRTKR